MNSRLEKIIDLKQPQLPDTKIKQKLNEIYVNPKCPIFNYVNSLAADTSKETVTRCLQAIAKHTGYADFYEIKWAEITSTDLNSLIHNLKAKELSPKTISLYVSVVKGVCEHAYLLGQISRLQLDGILKVKGETGSRIKKHQVISRSSFQGLLERIASSNPTNRNKMLRDLALFHILIGTGLRRSELATIEISSLVLELSNEDRVTVNTQYLKIIGKGNKERYVAIHPITKIALEDWLNVRGIMPGPLFVKVPRSGDIVVENSNPLTGSAIYELCKKYNTVAPHSLRRSYATWLDEKGVKISRISKLLGHSKEVTTAMYIVDEDSKAFEDVLNNLF